MSRTSKVSVVTPFFNTAEFLPECIESVLGQTFGDFEYILSDNASTDGGREIVEDYAAKDSRIRVHHFDEHLPQLANYNRALRLVDPGTRYAKIAQADDLLKPRFLEEAVALADTDDEIGFVVGYVVQGRSVLLGGLRYDERVLDGKEVGRRYLSGGPYIFGSPTNCMYRTEDVLAREEFFLPTSRLGDADAALRTLTHRKLAFVHEILSYTREREGSISAVNTGIVALTRRVMTERYGEVFLDPETLARQRRRLRNRHNRVLGEGLLRRKGAAFWEFHRHELELAGLRLSRAGALVGAGVVLVRQLVHPEWWFRRGWPWHR